MITARRLHEARAGAPSPPPTPATISYGEHQLAIQELTRSYEIRLNAPRGEAAVDESAQARLVELEALLAAVTGLQASTPAADYEVKLREFVDAMRAADERTAKFDELEASLAAAQARLTELEAMLDEATKAPPAVVTPAEASPAEPAPAQPAETKLEPKAEAKSGKPDDDKSRKAKS